MDDLKSLYELKQDSIKTKYKKRIAELKDSYDNDKEKLTEKELRNKYDELLSALSNEADSEIKEIKKEKHSMLESYSKKIRNNIIIADICLFLGIALLTFGIYMKHKMNIEPEAIEILLIVFGSVIMVSAGIFFGAADHNRQKRHEYFEKSYSESELASTRSMVHEFCDSLFGGE